MSGGWKTWGDRLRNALEMYREKNSPSFEFFYQDEATCDSAKALQSYRFLRSAYDLKIFVVCCMNGARAILPLAKKDGVLLISAGFQEQDLFSEDGVLVNMALQIGSEAERLAIAIEAAGVRKLALLRSVGTDEFLHAMRARFEVTKQVEIVYDEALEGTERDVASVLLQARARAADGIFINLSEPQLLDVLRRLRNQHSEAILFSSYGVEGLSATNPEIRILAKGLRFTRTERTEDPVFDQEFRARFAEEPVVNVYFLYDGIALLGDALQECSFTDTRCLFTFFASDEWRSGHGGKFRIRRNGSIERKFEVRRLADGSTSNVLESGS